MGRSKGGEVMNRFTLSYKHLKYLLDQKGLEVPNTSPVFRYLERLKEAEPFEMDPAIIQTLTQENSRLTIRFGGGTKRPSEQVLCFGDLIVGIQFDKDVTIFVYEDPLEIIDLIIRNYANKSEYATKNILPPSCSLDEFICVLNSIDMYRKLYYQSMLSYKGNRAMGFTSDDYISQLNQSIKERDIRWLTPCFMTIVPNMKLADMTDQSMNILLDHKLCQLMKNEETGQVGLYFTEEGKALGLEFERTWVDTLGFEFVKKGQVTSRCFLAITALSNHFVEIKETVNHQSFQYEQLHLKLENLIKSII